MKQKFGYLESPKDYRDYVPYSASNVELPEEYVLPNPHIKNQGSVNSCVAHSLSSFLEEQLEKNFSTGWIYGYRPEGYYQGEGMYPREALKTLLNVGAVLNSKFSYNIEMKEAKEQVDSKLDTLVPEANKIKIEGYARLSTERQIKEWVSLKNLPVPVCIRTEHITLSEDNIIQIPKKYPPAGHCMLIIGYNKVGYIVQNSWGEQWGDKGKAILPYEYDISEAWGISISTENKEEPQVKKPKLYIGRSFLQFIREILRAIYYKQY